MRAIAPRFGPALLHGVRPYLLLAALCVSLFAPGLASLPPIDRDEPRYLQATRQMLETGDFVQIRFQNTERHNKPAGVYWVQAAFVHALGNASGSAAWPYRLPSALAALAGVLLTFWAGTMLFNRATALLGAAIFASTFMLVYEAHLATPEALLLVTVLSAQCALAKIYTKSRRGEAPALPTLILFWAAIGFGLLVKGPITLMIAFLSLAALSLMDRRTKMLRRLRPAIGIPIALAIFLPWVAAISLATGKFFITDAISVAILPKLAGGQQGHGFPPGYYIALMTVTFWPGSMFVWPALIQGIKRRAEPALLFCLSWIVPSWIVFELVPTKLPHYVLPLYPALALLTAWAILNARAGRLPRPRPWSGGIGIVAWGIIGMAGGVLFIALPLAADQRFDSLTIVPAAAAVTLSALGLWLVWRGRYPQAMAAVILISVLVFAPIYQSVLPRLGPVDFSSRIAAMVSRHASKSEGAGQLVVSGYEEPSLVFLLGTGTRIRNPRQLREALRDTSVRLALISDSVGSRFHDAVRRANVSVRSLDRIQGFNYSKGNRVALTLFAISR